VLVRYTTPTGTGVYIPNQANVLPPIYEDVQFLHKNNTLIIRTNFYLQQADYHILAYYTTNGQLLYRQGLTPKMYQLLQCQ